MDVLYFFVIVLNFFFASVAALRAKPLDACFFLGYCMIAITLAGLKA